VRALGAAASTRRGRLRAFVAAVRRQIARGRYDIVHAMLPVPGADVYQPRGGTVPAQEAAALRRREGARRALLRLSKAFNLRRRASARLERTVAADGGVLCLCVSRMVADEFDQYYGRRQRVQVIYNGVDVPDPDSPRRAESRRQLRTQLRAGDATLFVSIANNPALKGAAETIRALARWRSAPADARDARAAARAHLVFVGRRSYGDRLHRLAASLGLDDRVKFIPHTPEIFAWYAAADAVVLLSWYDPCSRVVLEATRWGIPSITTAFNGAAEILSGGAGIVVDSPADIEAAAAAMARLADPAERARCAEACRKAAPMLTIQRHVDELLMAYETLL
jgi:UDP-glucose:(heptosyl)LPS alpha-1,3-glucosyltransferase